MSENLNEALLGSKSENLPQSELEKSPTLKKSDASGLFNQCTNENVHELTETHKSLKAITILNPFNNKLLSSCLYSLLALATIWKISGLIFHSSSSSSNLSTPLENFNLKSNNEVLDQNMVHINFQISEEFLHYIKLLEGCNYNAQKAVEGGKSCVIGYGHTERNRDSCEGWSANIDEINEYFDNDINNAEYKAVNYYTSNYEDNGCTKSFEELSQGEKSIFLDIAFNSGPSKAPKFVKAICTDDKELALEHCCNFYSNKSKGIKNCRRNSFRREYLSRNYGNYGNEILVGDKILDCQDNENFFEDLYNPNEDGAPDIYENICT